MNSEIVKLVVMNPDTDNSMGLSEEAQSGSNEQSPETHTDSHKHTNPDRIQTQSVGD